MYHILGGFHVKCDDGISSFACISFKFSKEKNDVPKKGCVSCQSCRGNERCVEPHGFLLGTEAGSGAQGSATEGFFRVHWATWLHCAMQTNMESTFIRFLFKKDVSKQIGRNHESKRMPCKIITRKHAIHRPLLICFKWWELSGQCLGETLHRTHWIIFSTFLCAQSLYAENPRIDASGRALDIIQRNGSPCQFHMVAVLHNSENRLQCLTERGRHTFELRAQSSLQNWPNEVFDDLWE